MKGHRKKEARAALATLASLSARDRSWL